MRINETFATTHSKYVRTNIIEGAPRRNVGVQTDDHISTGSKVLFIATVIGFASHYINSQS